MYEWKITNLTILWTPLQHPKTWITHSIPFSKNGQYGEISLYIYIYVSIYIYIS